MISAPLAFLRVFMGRCRLENSGRLECYRRTRLCDRLIAFRRTDGSWYIRRKYRLIYSEHFLRRLLTRKYPEYAD